MPKRTSTRDLIYHRLELKINAGELRPGQELDISPICDELGVSRTPVNQALLLLEANGLIEFAANGRPQVRRRSPKEVEDTYFILATLEGLMAKLGTPNLRSTDLARMKGLLVEARALIDSQEYSAFRDATLSFRRVLYNRCGNGRLVELVNSLWAEVSPLGTWLLSQAGLASARLDRDRQIFAACEAGDAERVQHLVSEGVSLAGERISHHLWEELHSAEADQ